VNRGMDSAQVTSRRGSQVTIRSGGGGGGGGGSVHSIHSDSEAAGYGNKPYVCWAGRSWDRITSVPPPAVTTATGHTITTAAQQQSAIQQQRRFTLALKNNTLGNTNSSSHNAKSLADIEQQILKIRIISYHVLADYKCKNFNYTPSKYWEGRSGVLLSEIVSYDADIMMFQDVDHYHDMWQPKLMLLGYDSVFKMKTQTRDTFEEGCVIAYKRNKYQLFKTVAVEFNHSIDEEVGLKTTFIEKCKTDDVGIIAFLQPFATNPFPSAICCACAMFCEKDGYSDVRAQHAKYLCRTIEKSNSEFHLPVIVGLSMNDIPFSKAYHIMTSGRIPLSTQPPRQCTAPVGRPTCRGSVRLRWHPPKMSLGEPQINYFRICWRPGGNLSLGFKAMIQVVANDCTQFEERLNRNGELRAVPLSEVAFTITGLSSDTPYEFKVAAVSDLGEGEWSEPSLPIVLPNSANAPKQLPARHLLDMDGVLEQSERLKMKDNDIDVEVRIHPALIADSSWC
jgi:hypothetical protein